MGHYDSCYEAEEDAYREKERKRAQVQLDLMDEFISSLNKIPGKDGISKRHLEAFQDMRNETKLRTK